MVSMLSLLLTVLKTACSSVNPHRQLVPENLALRQQLAMLKQTGNRPRVSIADRLFWVLFSKTVNGWRANLHVMNPDTVVRWHRKGFRLYWRWKSRRRRVGRPPIDVEIRKLIRQMVAENVGWGAPRIHGELLKLGIQISQATVSNYMQSQRKPPSQTWRTFVANHADCLSAIDFFTVPTATFCILYEFIVLSHDRRQIVHFNVTERPTARWTAQQMVEAFPYDTAPRYLLRDRDGIYGEAVRRRIKRMDIDEVVTALKVRGKTQMLSTSWALFAAIILIMLS